MDHSERHKCRVADGEHRWQIYDHGPCLLNQQRRDGSRDRKRGWGVPKMARVCVEIFCSPEDRKGREAEGWWGGQSSELRSFMKVEADVLGSRP